MDLLFTSAGPFITSNPKIRGFIESTSTKTKKSKQSKKLEANQEAIMFPYCSKRTIITVLKILIVSVSFFLILNFSNKV